MKTIILNHDMDSVNIQKSKLLFENLAKETKNVTFDFTNVHNIDGSGIGALAYVYKRLKAKNYTVNVTNIKGQPKEMMKKLNLLKILQ